MQYRRARVNGGTYFFTVVTFKREKILTLPDNVNLLRKSFKHVMQNHPYKIDAFVLLPEHLHCIWTLPDNDMDYSKRWRLIKSYFTRKCDDTYKHVPYESRKNKNEQAIWQRRFWEHLIRDESDFKKHVEYIHYNPVKHDLVKSPKDWTYSSFNRYVKSGIYNEKWGSSPDIKMFEGAGME